MKLASLVVLAACASSHPPPATPAPAAEPIAKACEGAEFRQLDFWVGDWTVAIHARAKPGEDQWQDAPGTQHVTHTLKGCAIEENFTAEAPIAFAGRSFSTIDAIAKKWRQTWVDDSGGYLAFSGGPEGGGFVLYGEPRDLGGTKFQMRMVWSKITHDALRWEWQRSEDNWATNQLMIGIDYTRVR
jgi:hypothetical protein